ncbi:MAG: MG2 domain-containing protein [Flavobacteriales bacterium]
MDRRANAAPTPLRQLLRSQLAELWWQRYARDRWRILERTETDASFDAADPETWSQGRFMERILRESSASLEPYDTLRRMPVGELGGLLHGDPRARYLRPSVFDVLAHRALALYSNSEARLSQPSWRFTLDQPWHFNLFEPFIFRPLAHRDSTAHEFLALRLYQRLERASINRDSLDAYVDIALQRLAYVRERSNLPEKDSLYLGSLELLRSRLPEDPSEAEVMVAIARWHEDQSRKYDRLGGEAWKWEKRTARALCEEAIAKWPDSFGARNARAMIARLTQPSIALQAEQAVPADRPFLFALTYANAAQVALRVVPANDAERAGLTEPVEDWLLRQKPLREWLAQLPDDGDLNSHVAELPVEGLPYGRYALMATSRQTFDKGGAFAWCAFQVTDMAMVSRREGSKVAILVLDRGTGKPKAGVKATARADRYETGALRSDAVATAVTEADGTASVVLPESIGTYHWLLESGADRLQAGSRWFGRGYDGGDEEEMRSFLFTDRAIYRPGQELFFKGIAVQGKGREQRVKPDFETTVFLYDANDEEVDSLVVRTDAFGAYHGKFTLPLNRLTGKWYLEDEELTGEKYFLVEEYKRPTFELVFDPVTAAPRLGEEAEVSGVARSYAGAPLDGARVRYTVSRGVRMPWWCGRAWRGLPWWRTTEIASGEAACDAQGKFVVRFTAAADRAFPREADPVFSYSVEAWVTDITGETQRAGATLLAGYRSIELDMPIGEALDRSTADSLALRVANLNGVRMDIPFDVRVVRLLKPEGNPKRDRPWERPDRHVLTERDFAQRFPDDAYGNEGDSDSWPEGAVVMERVAVDAKGGRIALDGIEDWEVGTYRISMRATDPSGTPVEASKVFTLYDPDIQNTGFENRAFHVQAMKDRCEPGEKAVLLLSTALPECRVLMEVERDGRIAVTRPFQLKPGQQRVELPVMEEDRGGFTVHFVCVERGRQHVSSQRIEVPWSNKQLKVEWMSFRDKLLPGAEEEWRVKITGPKKEQVAAQVLAAMYDASLDQFAQPEWALALWPASYPKGGWEGPLPLGATSGRAHGGGWAPGDSIRQYPMLLAGEWGGGRGRYHGGLLMRGARADVADGEAEYELRALPGVAARTEAVTVAGDEVEGLTDLPRQKEVSVTSGIASGAPPASAPSSPLRADFRETAFFFPDLLTDRDGSVVLRFTMPDALTRWNLMGLAHTKDLSAAQFTKSAITQKPLMAVPNLPRYFRQGDRITVTAKINVVEGGSMTGDARLQLFDPRTNEQVSSAFGLNSAEQAFTAAPGQSALAKWTLTIPEGLDAVAARITANAAGISDGEERVLPILTDRVLVTESLPIAITKAGTKSFELKNLVNAQSTTLRHQSLKLEYTPNPAWYAVQALPYLMEFPHECAEQVFSRYYANRIAGHIVQQRPQVKKLFEAWSQGAAGNEQAFLSALDKNPELKGIALEETPWLLTARDEGERKRRIALFFDLHRMANEEAASLKKLVDMQLGNGAWGWWSGMRPSRYITQHVVAGFGHLQQLGALDLDPDTDARRSIKRAIDWLDQEVEREHQRRLGGTVSDSLPDPAPEDIHYLYARSYFPQHPLRRKGGAAVEFMLERAARNAERKLLREVGLFDVYQGEKLPPGKKSYALSFILQDAEKTLTDEQVEKAMGRIRAALEKEAGAEVRG